MSKEELKMSLFSLMVKTLMFLSSLPEKNNKKTKII